MLKIVTSVSSEPEAQMICQRLSESGITAIPERSIGGPTWGRSGAQDVYVDESDLERARALLASEAQPVSDEELARLAEEAGPAPPD